MKRIFNEWDQREKNKTKQKNKRIIGKSNGKCGGVYCVAVIVLQISRFFCLV